MQNFIYNIPTKVYFGKDEELKVGSLINEYHPHKVLIHYGGKTIINNGLLAKIKKSLDETHIAYCELGGVKPNPQLGLVYEGIKLGLKEGVDFVLAIGGGSVLDSSKAISHGISNPQDDVWDYITRKKTPNKTLPKGAILTISAAGSEMSNSCVISNEKTGEKRGFNADINRYDFAIENPVYTFTVSKYQTAAGCVDIAMHTIERFFFFGEDTTLNDALSISVIKTAFSVGKKCLDNPEDYAARANMMWCSSLAHNGLTGCAKTGTMAVHQLEHEVSGLYPSVTHGAGLAAIWPSWARYVYKANLDRWAKYANEVWNEPVINGDKEGAILRAIKKQEDFYKEIGMPNSLRELGVEENSLEKLALMCSRNHTRIIEGFKPLDYEDMLAIYQMAY